MNVLPKTNYNKKINKIFYIVLFMVILCGVLFYLDMLNYLSLQNIVSVILGFLIMIFVQMRFISYYFEDRMQELDLDEFGVIKDLIKSKIFGEINLNYISKKLKQKYYYHTKDEKDRLFADENQQTFQCVITALRAKNQVDHHSRIIILRDKWDLLLMKISQFQIFLTNLFKIYKERVISYKKFNEKIANISDYDIENWQVLFTKNHHLPEIQNNQYAKHLEHNDGTDWTDMKKVIWERYHLIESKTKQISTQLLTQFKAFANQLRTEHRQTMTELQNSQNQLAISRKTYREILDKIELTTKKIDNLTDKIKRTRAKGSGNMQTVFNTEYDLRFLFVQLDNLEVRKTYVRDMNHKSTQAQYKLCLEKEDNLQNSWIKKFNNKISLYLVSYFDKLKVLIPKHKQINKMKVNNELLKIEYAYNSNNKRAYESLHELTRRHNQFKAYIPQLLTLHEEQIRNIKKINELIKDYDKQMKKSSFQHKYAQDSAFGEKIIECMFFDLIESVNKKEIEILSKTINLLREQQIFIEKKQEKKEMVTKQSMTVRKQKKEIKPVENPTKDNNQLKNGDYFAGYTLTLIEAYEFQLANRIPSCLYEILLCSIQGYSIIIKQIDERKDQVELKVTFFASVDPKQTRMNEYKEELFKLERQQFLREEKNGKMEQIENDDRSLAIINKIFSVFISEWRNSQFFHEILKEEIEVSLNQKRPPFLGYIGVKYIKIIEKEGDIFESINLLGDNVFVCLFEMLINFKGKVAVHIETELKAQKIPINVRVLVTEFRCPVRICFTPFSLGKSYVSMMKSPKLTIQYNAKLGSWEISKIPFISLFIEIFIVIKLRKKFLYPKRATVKVPLAVKNAIAQAIKQRAMYEKLLEKKRKND